MREEINGFPVILKKKKEKRERSIDKAQMEARLLQQGVLQEKRAAITRKLLERAESYS